MPSTKYYSRGLTAALLGVLSVYAYCTWQVLQGVLPVWDDEYSYFANARSFFENTTLRAAFTYTGEGSRLFHSDVHGFAYPLLNGLIAKVVGFHDINIPLTNLAFIPLAIILIFSQADLTSLQKMFIAFCLLSYPVVVLFTFTFMPESVHLFIAVCCAILLKNIYTTHDRRWIVAFIGVLLLASLFRNLWLFWSVALLPLAKTRKAFLFYVALFLLLSSISFLFVKLFWDPLPSPFSSMTIHVHNGNSMRNLTMLVHAPWKRQPVLPYLATDLFTIFLFGAMIFHFLKTKSRFSLAVILVCIVNIGLLLLLFKVMGWGEVRTMAPLYYLFIVFIAYHKERLPVIVTLIFLSVAGPSAVVKTRQWIHGRNSQASCLHNDKTQIAAYAGIADVVATDKEVRILLGYVPRDHSKVRILLPVKSHSGRSICYVNNCFRLNLPRDRFDYVLYQTPLPEPPPGLLPTVINKYFSLYRVTITENRTVPERN